MEFYYSEVAVVIAKCQNFVVWPPLPINNTYAQLTSCCAINRSSKTTQSSPYRMRPCPDNVWYTLEGEMSVDIIITIFIFLDA